MTDPSPARDARVDAGATFEYGVQRLYPDTGEPYGYVDGKSSQVMAHATVSVYAKGTARVVKRQVSDWTPDA